MKSICADVVLQRLSPASGATLNRQLYECLREAILDGSLPPSSALPASRDLARESAMSRNTVLHAYAQLQAEGYVHSRVGSGTFVAEVAPDNFLSAGRPLAEPATPRAPVRLSKRAQALLATLRRHRCNGAPSCPASPMSRSFPIAPSAASSRGCGARRRPSC